MLRLVNASSFKRVVFRAGTSYCVQCVYRPTHQELHAAHRRAQHNAGGSNHNAAEPIRTISLPPYMRLRDFAKRLGGRINVNKLLIAIGGRRAKRKIFWDDVQTNRSFVFNDMKQMVLPYHTMEHIVNELWENSVKVEMEQVEPTLRSLPNVHDPEDATNLGLVERRAVVAVLGHIDHGKTTLVDAFRGTNTVNNEEGGITQAIGAWPVSLRLRDHDNNTTTSIRTTFLDTPGHVHFYQMREDSARVATAALLVVACDEDELGDQTLESINCLLDMDVPVVVAINKIDVETARPDQTIMLLQQNGVLNETVGGTQPTVVNVSAKEKINLEELEHAVGVATTRQPLLAFGEDVLAEGIVIEAANTRHRGALLRLVVSAGALRLGQPYVCGRVVGVVRAMYDEFGKEKIEEAWPGQVVYVSGSRVGLTDTPPLGEPFFVTKDRKQAENLVDYRQMLEELEDYQVSGPPLLYSPSSFEEEPEEESLREPSLEEDDRLPLILKAESAGKLDALLAALAENDSVLPIRASVGPPRKSDVEAASGMKVPVVCFGLKVPSQIEKEARKHGVPLMKGMVLHELIDSLKGHKKRK